VIPRGSAWPSVRSTASIWKVPSAHIHRIAPVGTEGWTEAGAETGLLNLGPFWLTNVESVLALAFSMYPLNYTPLIITRSWTFVPERRAKYP